jgi:hypothetical protein
MVAMTTSSSIRVKAFEFHGSHGFIGSTPQDLADPVKKSGLEIRC